MHRAGTTALLSAALGVLLLVLPAESAQRTPFAPPVKGVVLGRLEQVLIVDQVLGPPVGHSRTVRVLVSSRTLITGRRTDVVAIRRDDLIRADGVVAADGSLDASAIEVILTAGDMALRRPGRGGRSGLLWDWILTGSLSLPLP